MSYRYKQIHHTLSNLLLLVLVLSLYHLEWQRKIEIRTEGYFVCVYTLHKHTLCVHAREHFMHPFVCSLHVFVCTRLHAFMCACLYVCEGEARLLCRGEVDTSMVALCLLALEAKGHKTGINYIERKVCVCMPIVDCFF